MKIWLPVRAPLELFGYDTLYDALGQIKKNKGSAIVRNRIAA